VEITSIEFQMQIHFGSIKTELICYAINAQFVFLLQWLTTFRTLPPQSTYHIPT